MPNKDSKIDKKMENRFMVRRVSNSVVPMPNLPEHMELQVNPSPNGFINHAFITDMGIPQMDRKRSFAHHTIEALPRLDNYRNDLQALKRPSLGELHGEEKDMKDVNENIAQPPEAGGHGVKLGWIQGVLIPCLLNIWGVMLFLRLAWVVAQSGIGETLIIIGLSAVVCVLTTTSMSAICTNGEVRGGGIYYIISRSLGPEFGASVGIVFAFANAVAASMNTIGFCNSLNDLLRENGLKIVDGGDNDVRIIGTVAILIMIFICAVGMEWEAKAQNVLLVIILAAILDFIVGACIGPLTDEQRAKGFNGLSGDLFKQNWGPDYRISEQKSQDFFSVFAIFFPSVTGIQAGANISGDLKVTALVGVRFRKEVIQHPFQLLVPEDVTRIDGSSCCFSGIDYNGPIISQNPAYAIPNGTMLALVISMISYAVFVFVAGATAYRDASGIVSELTNGTFTYCANRTCEYGLANSYTIMQMMSSWGPLIFAGCFAATLSTALTNLLSVPRLIQAIGNDRIYPGLIFFSKGYGKNHEAYRGYVLTFFVSVAFLLIAQLNAIAPLISNFYLASYALINFCTFHAALIKPLGWRPTYRYYNMWLSLLGFILCVGVMFLIDWVTSLITMIVIFALYLLVVYRKPDVNWGSSTQAQTYKTALSSAQRLVNIGEHVKNYRPQILVLSGKPCSRPALVDVAYLITKNNALMICGEILENKLSYKARQKRIRMSYEWLRDRKIKSFYSLIDEINFEKGANSLLQAIGVGKLRPNVLMMGYKNDWTSCPRDQLTSYFHVLHEAFYQRIAVVILRLEGGLDYSSVTDDEEQSKSIANDLTGTSINQLTRSTHSDENFETCRVASENECGFLPVESPQFSRRYNVNEKLSDPKDILKQKKKAYAEQIIQKSLHDELSEEKIPQNMLQMITLFERKQNPGTIDVWWLYDDGGLTILLPYIISARHNWSSCKLRIFALANRKHELELEERNMASLLSKFRIDYSGLVMVEDITENPKEETLNFFQEVLKEFNENNGKDKDSKCEITDSELESLRDKTNRHLRLREFLLQHSSQAKLVVMSLPMPRKGMVSAPLYMAWLECITRDMPPILLIRGNQTSVLTFYS